MTWVNRKSSDITGKTGTASDNDGFIFQQG